MKARKLSVEALVRIMSNGRPISNLFALTKSSYPLGFGKGGNAGGRLGLTSSNTRTLTTAVKTKAKGQSFKKKERFIYLKGTKST
jgi:hypothetical protein